MEEFKIAVRKYPQKPKVKDTLPSISLENIQQKRLITLTRITHDYDRMSPEPTYHFSQLIAAIQTLGKTISAVLRKSGLSQRHILGSDAYQKSPRELTNLFEELAVKLLESSNSTCLILVKNVKDIIQVAREHAGRYIVAISVLDKEVSRDASACMGTSFCIFKRAEEISDVCVDEIMQPGKNATSAGYIVYGNITILVLAMRKKVQVFLLDPILGEFILTNEDWKIPDYHNFYSVNEGYSEAWDEKLHTYFNSIKNSQKEMNWISRYTGSFVTDCHHVLQIGGIYLYPPNKVYPSGIIGLQYEAVPFAFIANLIGGVAISGKELILQITPDRIHQQTPIYLGTKKHIYIFRQFFEEKNVAEKKHEL